ncbi:hypothetical protein OS175_10425 [Marinicella sp. S1101]|uniref:right-handed parallel beta-helix repeat-containing protein n=1 Tax=Marinicella marina TaxID=2996016 RepID=UPI0022608155|nr:right-handed parallel beta-helix repeat-containing protein [Marinicella marina]MCX7554295.1 hypothetical protein [Marinicella marina]MDJ1138714.1 choice-of-anchor Q domain-containing protein [Marinicella marina]
MKNLKMKKTLLCSALLTAMGSAQSATITVNDDCTLIDAINSANNDTAEGLCGAGSGADVIQIQQPNLVINITGPLVPPAPVKGIIGGGVEALPSIESEVTIEGNGLTLNADYASDPVRVFTVGYGADLTLRDTTVTGADSALPYGGSGLFSNGGRVTLENTTFDNNSGGVFLVGGSGHVIDNSVIRHNTLDAADYAAGLTMLFTTAQISRTSLFDNEIIDAPYILGGGGGGPGFAGGITSIQSEVSITESTISGNRSPFGGGIIIKDQPYMPIFSQRSLPGQLGGGPMIENEVTITNSTITNNQSYYASGILNFSEYGTLTIAGTIVAGNDESIFNFAANIYNANPTALVLDGNNIIGDNGSSGTVGVELSGTNTSFINDIDDNLYPLTLSKGQLVHPLKVNSAAIDSNDLACAGSLTDQTGKARGLDGDGNGSFVCDIGASEHTTPIVADGAPCTLSNAILSANNDASIGGCQPGNFHDIITLPENSTQSVSATADYFVNGFFNSPFGLPSIDTAITLEGNNSSIQRDPASLENFDLLLIEDQGQLNLIDSTVSGANGQLAAVAAMYGGNVNVVSTTISGSESMGLLDIISINTSLVDSAIEYNTIGINSYVTAAAGIFTVQSNGVLIEQSSINNNANAYFGGMLINGNSLTKITNSTISNNTGNNAGGVVIAGTTNTQLKGLTVTGNQGGGITGGIYAAGAELITLSNSIISGNSITAPIPVPQSRVNPNSVLHAANNLASRGGPVTPPELVSSPDTITLNGTNILGQNGESGTTGVTITPGVIIPAGATDTVIETTLGNNGGSTKNHLPVAGGDAVDTGGVFCELRTDQINRIRPWDGDNDGNAACDVGAIERGSVTAADLIFKDGFDAEIIIRRGLKQ